MIDPQITYDPWTFVSELGSGSFGTVYKIEREDFGIKVDAALKIIPIPQSRTEVASIRSQGMTEKEVTQYFYAMAEEVVKEFQLMFQLKGHSNIVSYEDHEIRKHSDGVGYDILIRMELLEPLDDFCSHRIITQKDVAALGIDICRALERCHSLGIVHRDIKPSNIFVSKQGDFKLGDFGIARKMETATAELSRKGTFGFMAPEVAAAKHYDFTVDVYSLGLVMYKLLNGHRLPFMPPAGQPIMPHDQNNAAVRRLSGEPLPAPPDACDAFAEVVLKACSFKAEDRFKSASEFKEAIKGILPEIERDEAQKTAFYPAGTVAGDGNSLDSESSFEGNGQQEEFFPTTIFSDNDAFALDVEDASTEIPDGGAISAVSEAPSEGVSEDAATVFDAVSEDATTVLNAASEDATTVLEDDPAGTTTVLDAITEDPTTIFRAIPEGATTVEDVFSEGVTTVFSAVPKGATTTENVVSEDATTVLEGDLAGTTTVLDVITEDATTVLNVVPEDAATAQDITSEDATTVLDAIPEEAVTVTDIASEDSSPIPDTSAEDAAVLPDETDEDSESATGKFEKIPEDTSGVSEEPTELDEPEDSEAPEELGSATTILEESDEPENATVVLEEAEGPEEAENSDGPVESGEPTDNAPILDDASTDSDDSETETVNLEEDAEAENAEDATTILEDGDSAAEKAADAPSSPPATSVDIPNTLITSSTSSTTSVTTPQTTSATRIALTPKTKKLAAIAGAIVAVLLVAFIVVSNGQSDPQPENPEPQQIEVTVPDVVGMAQAEAENAIKAAGLTPTVTTAYDDKVKSGLVVSQNIAGNATEGSEVALVVSMGIEQVEVPKVKGMTKAKAKKTLKAAGLVAIFAKKGDYSSKIVKDHILKQSVKAGSKVNKGSKVKLTLSKGEKPKPAPTYHYSRPSHSSSGKSHSYDVDVDDFL